MSALAKRLDIIEPQINAMTGNVEPSVYGVVDRVDRIDGVVTPHCIRKWEGTIGNMTPSDREPTIYLVDKLEPLILKHKKYKCLYGGRGGTKSRFAQDIMAGDVNTSASKVFVLRERMKSLKESIYAGIEKAIKDLHFGGFISTPSTWEIKNTNGGKLTFGGLQNVIDMKGASNYKFFLMEEAAKAKQATLDTLGPTLRDTENAELWFLWNCESSTDAMSQEFIVPYQAQLDRDGYYEDDYHLVIKIGYKDNYWFKHDKSLMTELKKDQEKVADGRMAKARFNHIWEGHFNDSIDTSVIIDDWFDACIDAHKKLGFGVDKDGNTDASGAKVAALDPSDVGKDADGYVERQGVIFTEVTEIDAENGNRAFDIASRKAKEFGADAFGYDGDGIGALLRDQAETNFSGVNTQVYMYKGSTEVHEPKGLFRADNSNVNMKEERQNKDIFANKKAQNIIGFAERVYKTYEAVELGKYHNPDDLISFDSSTIAPNMMQKLKAESCKLPLKPGDTIRFYTKEELRKGVTMPDGHKVVIPSPNLFDACVVSLDRASTIYNNDPVEDIVFTSLF